MLWYFLSLYELALLLSLINCLGYRIYGWVVAYTSLRRNRMVVVECCLCKPRWSRRYCSISVFTFFPTCHRYPLSTQHGHYCLPNPMVMFHLMDRPAHLFLGQPLPLWHTRRRWRPRRCLTVVWVCVQMNFSRSIPYPKWRQFNSAWGHLHSHLEIPMKIDNRTSRADANAKQEELRLMVGYVFLRLGVSVS